MFELLAQASPEPNGAANFFVLLLVIGGIWWIASCFQSKPKGVVIKGHSHTVIEPKR